MTMIRDYDHVCQRAEQLEREGAREMRKLAEAKAIAGPEHVNGSDGTEILVADGGSEKAELREGETEDETSHCEAIVQEQLAEADPGDLGPGPLDVGDHVQDEQDPDATMLVVNLDTLQADAYELEDGLTVADVNPEYPADDDVVEVIYPNRTDLDLEGKKEFAFPKSRLEVVNRVHDRDDDGSEDDDPDGDEWIENDRGDTVPERSEPADFGGGESTGVQEL